MATRKIGTGRCKGLRGDSLKSCKKRNAHGVKKGWTKKTFDDGSFMYENKRRDGDLHIGEKSVTIGIDNVEFQGVELRKTRIHEKFDTPKEAQTFAKKYMRNHQ